MVVLGYLPKLKCCLGLAFGERFLYAFSTKMLLNALSIDKVQCYIFFPSQYQAKYVIKFLFRKLLTS